MIKNKESSLGRVLVDLGYITEAQLQEALLEQKVNRGKCSGREEAEHARGKKKKLLAKIPNDAREAERASLRLVDALSAYSS